MKQDVVMVYMTLPSLDLAQTLVRTLLEEKLIACGNIFPEMLSSYVWQGKIEQAREVAVVMKSIEGLYKKLEERICQIHPYECPCIVALPVTNGLPAFLKWVQEAVDQNAQREQNDPIP